MDWIAKRSDRLIVGNVVKGGATDTILSEAEMVSRFSTASNMIEL
jgi:hypothetical protein